MAKGWLENFNDSKASAPEGFQGDGYSNVGRNYSPAWGGQFQYGGEVFLQPTDSKLPWTYNKKTKDYNSEVAMSIGGENGEPAYLIPTFKKGKFLKDPVKEYKKTGEHLGGPFKTWQDAEQWEKDVRHPAVEQHRSIIPYTYSNMQMGGNVYPVNYVPKAQMGGSIPGAVGFTYARTQSPAPSNGPYAKKTKASAQKGKAIPKFNLDDFKKKKEINLREEPREIVRDNTRVVFRDEKGKQREVNPNLQIKTKHNAEKIRQQEIAERKARIADSMAAQKEKYTSDNWRELLARETQAIGDKLRISEEPNFFDDYLNPAVWVGDMSSNLGQAPLQAQQTDSYMPYVTSIGTPLTVGALTGLGASSNSQFVNNLVNPLAGTGDLAKDLYNKGINALEKRGIRTSIAPEVRQGLRTNGISFEPKFKSEIDWGQWNKEIPDNAQLMKEYNAIEQTTKANDTWMKNADGSAFQGTPEQFIQQNSENFKKAFGNTKFRDEKGNPMILHHGHFTKKDFSSFLPPSKTGISNSGYEGNYSFFTPHKSLAEDYSGIGMVDDIPGYKSYVKSVYVNSEKPLLDARTEFVDTDIPRSILNKYDSVTASLNPKELSEVAVPYGNNVKSAIGNNGMFDMTNPNIYKAMLPIGLGLGAASQLEEKPVPGMKQGGVIKDDLGQWAHPGEITEINSNDITMEGVPYDVLGISDTGDVKLMKPGKNYKFKGKKVTEYPMAKNGVNQQDEKSLQQLDQLTNFTNYNTKQPGGWLDTL